MAQEFAEVGVQVTVDKRDPQTYYSNLEELHQAQAATAFWINRNPITEFRSQVMPDYPFNLSGFTSETIQQNLAKATATLDAAEQKKLVGEINKEIHDQGGDLIWGYQKQVSAYRGWAGEFQLRPGGSLADEGHLQPGRLIRPWDEPSTRRRSDPPSPVGCCGGWRAPRPSAWRPRFCCSC